MDIKDIAKARFLFYDENGNLADPTLVSAWVEEPDGTIVVLAVVKDGVGMYHSLYTIIKSGDHWVRCEGTGAIAAAKEKRFNVAQQKVVHS